MKMWKVLHFSNFLGGIILMKRSSILKKHVTTEETKKNWSQKQFPSRFILAFRLIRIVRSPNPIENLKKKTF